MRSILAVLLLLSACDCSHAWKSRPVTGELGRQCGPEARRVFCDVSLSDADCEHVELAIDYINFTSDMHLLTFAGRSHSEAESQMRFEVGEVPVLFQDAGPLDMFSHEPQELAHTAMMTDEGNMCVGPAFIMVIRGDRDFSASGRQTMFRHELLHLLGVAHNTVIGGDRKHHILPDLMYPAGNIDSEEPQAMSQADLNALRAIYGTF